MSAEKKDQVLPSGGVVYYEGTWRSDTYPWMVAHGTVAAEVNYDTKSAKILLRYDGTFLYGTTKQLETKIEDGKSTSTAAAASAETTTPYVFTLKTMDGAIVGATKQSLKFTASSITLQAIVGNYKSYAPADNGTFNMHAISKQQFHDFATKSNGCTIA